MQSACDYPWEPMPDQGRRQMLRHAQRVVDNAMHGALPLGAIMIGNQAAEDLRRCCDALEADNKRLRRLVAEMAENDIYETEYDGRMYSICHGSGRRTASRIVARTAYMSAPPAELAQRTTGREGE